MNIQKNKLALAIMIGLLGSVSVSLHAEIQTDDEVINNDSPDIDLNDTDANEADWQICIDQNGCNGGSVAGINEGFHIVSDESGTGTGSIALQIENGAGGPTVPAVTIDSSGRVGIGNENPAEELNITSGFPDFRMDDTGGGRVDFNMNGNLFWLENEGNSDVFMMETNGGTAQQSQLYLDSDGDVGIQITNPAYDLTIGGQGQILMQNPGSSTNDYGFWSGTSGLWISRGNNTIESGTQVVKLQNTAPNNSLVLNSTGMGVGTETPTSALHVRKAGAVLTVEDTNGSSAVRNLIALSNQGAVGFSMEDRSQPVTWDFRTNGSGNFIMNDVGDGAEVTVLRNGNMIVSGNVTANGISLTSSREAKSDIVPAKPAEIMAKLKQVELAEWRYKEADKDDRHLSPIAEDFYSLFQYGASNKHINPNDLASVALIAAQELQKKADVANAELEANKANDALLKKHLDTKTAELKAENESLKKRLASLERLVTSLASADGSLKAQGEKVALSGQ